MPLVAADELDDVGELHVDDVDELAVLALADADDLVFGLQASVLVGRAAGNDLADDRVIPSSDCSDAPIPSNFRRMAILKLSSVARSTCSWCADRTPW